MHRWRFLSLTMALGLVLAACSGTSTSPSASTTASSSQTPASLAPFTATSYPAAGPATCGAAATATNGAYTGEFKQVKAIDRYTVEFDLCASDVAFLSKIAFSAFPINDSAYLDAHSKDKSIVQVPNGTGPYILKEWVKGDHMTFTANPNYWGEKAKNQTLIFKWSTESASRLVDLQSGTVDGIDNPGKNDLAAIQNDTTLKLYNRAGLNTFYLGMNVLDKPWDNELVRQAIAMGIDRQRIVDNFYPPGSEVAQYFTPCAIPFACVGDAWYSYNPTQAKALLAQAGYPNGFTTKIQYRNVDRTYLPTPPLVAQDIQAQLKTIGITATIEEQESGTFIDNNSAGKLTGLFMLGWGVDYPDQTDFMDYHFGAGSGAKFGKPFADIAAAITTGGTSISDADRTAAYTQVNDLLKQHVPMVPIAHAGSADAFKADVTGAHASPLGNEQFSVMTPGNRTTLVWEQNAEPLGLYCPDETDGESLRACEQVSESLYGYEVGGTKPIPALATQCTANTDLTVWTCTLRQGVTFDDGSTFDANDVVASYGTYWDATNPNHVGRSGAFDYFSSLFGGFLNPPLPTS
jgi:peptide/nickel transport system substrate-binding protein